VYYYVQEIRANKKSAHISLRMATGEREGGMGGCEEMKGDGGGGGGGGQAHCHPRESYYSALTPRLLSLLHLQGRLGGGWGGEGASSLHCKLARTSTTKLIFIACSSGSKHHAPQVKMSLEYKKTRILNALSDVHARTKHQLLSLKRGLQCDGLEKGGGVV
jgi:hypothetical protein